MSPDYDDMIYICVCILRPIRGTNYSQDKQDRQGRHVN